MAKRRIDKYSIEQVKKYDWNSFFKDSIQFDSNGYTPIRDVYEFLEVDHNKERRYFDRFHSELEGLGIIYKSKSNTYRYNALSLAYAILNYNKSEPAPSLVRIQELAENFMKEEKAEVIKTSNSKNAELNEYEVMLNDFQKHSDSIDSKYRELLYKSIETNSKISELSDKVNKLENEKSELENEVARLTPYEIAYYNHMSDPYIKERIKTKNQMLVKSLKIKGAA